MAFANAVTGSYTTGSPAAVPSAVGIREDLYDAIARISPTDVPFFSNATKGSVKNTIFDWLVIELAAPDIANKQPEGFEVNAYSATKPVRFNNNTQILAKAWAVSRTMDVVDTAGRAKERRFQQVLKGLEMRRDLETILLTPQAKAATDPRAVGTLGSWITNISHGGGTPPAGTGAGVYNPAGATNRALTLTLIEDAHQLAWNEGGSPTMLLMSGANKRKFRALGGGANPAGTVAVNRVNATPAQPVTLIGAVEAFLSDFGRLEVVPDRFCPSTVIYLLDTDWYEVVTLPESNFVNEELAKTGDSTKGMLTWEGSLRVRAPKAHAAIYDLT